MNLIRKNIRCGELNRIQYHMSVAHIVTFLCKLHSRHCSDGSLMTLNAVRRLFRKKAVILRQKDNMPLTQIKTIEGQLDKEAWFSLNTRKNLSLCVIALAVGIWYTVIRKRRRFQY